MTTVLLAPVDDATRRQFLTGVGTAALLVTGCATDRTPAPAPTAATRTVTDDLDRTVDIPTRPQRVAVIDDEVAAHLITVGYVPAGLAWSYAPDFRQTLRSFGGPPVDLDPIVDLGERNELNYEQLAALRPDLIIGFLREVPDQLTTIAPVVAVDPRTNADGEAFQQLRFLADLVGAGDQVEPAIQAYRDAVAAFRDRHAARLPGLTYLFWDVYDDGRSLCYDKPEYAVNAVFADLGVPMTPAMRDLTAASEFGTAELSVERMAEFDAALIFLGRIDDVPVSAGVTAVMSTTFAARNDQVFPVSSIRWTFHLLQAQLDVLAELDAIFSDRPTLAVLPG